jgi:predicted alpha-1,2-mannosidase
MKTFAGWAAAAVALAAVAGCSSGGGTTDTAADAVEVADVAGDEAFDGTLVEAAEDPLADPTADETAADADDVVEAADLAEVDTAPGPDDPPYARHIRPMIGTGGAVFNLGSAYPGAAAPFGLVKASPDTTLMLGGKPPGFQHCAGYRFEDDAIYGFTHNHLHGTGAPDYGNVLLLPTVGMSDAKTGREGYKTPFTHDDEVARAGYYAVTLTDPRVRVELTATTRCSHHRYEFLDHPDEGVVLVDAAAALLDGRSKGGEVTVDPANRTVEGWNHNHGEFSGRYGGFPVHFTIRFDRPFAGHGTWLDGKTGDGRLSVETPADPASFGAYLRFATKDDATVEAQVCLSYVSLDGARAAMAAELPAWDFEATAAATFQAWEKEAAVIEVAGGTEDQKISFYTAIYHALQMPTIWTDVDGKYYGFDREVHQADGWTYVTDLSLWDTYRTANPLYALAWPRWQLDVLRSLTAMKVQGGYVPKWSMGAGDTGSMIGEHAASTAADSYLKGLTDFDVETLWAGLKETADGPLPPGSYGGRGCIQSYLEKGYCPDEESDNSVSLTLEYAFNDFCMAELAKALGKTADATRYAERSTYWKNHWDGSTFLVPRRADGSFLVPGKDIGVDEWSPRGYVEGSVWQWNWFVPHDEDGLRALFPDDAAFVSKLTDFFQLSKDQFLFEMPNAYYFHGNEPDFHAPFMFIRAGRPDLTQKWARWVLEANYRTDPDGLSGNDDGGTMAAWYVFTAVGLFPWPCLPGYYLTSPIFDRVVLHLEGGDVTIEADGASAGKLYVKQVTWNGTPLPAMWIQHADLAKGGTLKFTLSDTP